MQRQMHAAGNIEPLVRTSSSFLPQGVSACAHVRQRERVVPFATFSMKAPFALTVLAIMTVGFPKKFAPFSAATSSDIVSVDLFDLPARGAPVRLQFSSGMTLSVFPLICRGCGRRWR
jgi:hypothetical protein